MASAAKNTGGPPASGRRRQCWRSGLVTSATGVARPYSAARFLYHLLSLVSVVATAIGACLLAFDRRRFEPSAVLPCFLALCMAALLPWSRCPEGDSAIDINGVSPPSAWSAIHGPANFQFIPPERRREFLAATARTLNRSGWLVVDKRFPEKARWLSDYDSAYALGNPGFRQLYRNSLSPKSFSINPTSEHINAPRSQFVSA